MADQYKMYLGGEWVDSAREIRVESPYDDSLLGLVAAASRESFAAAIDRAQSAFERTRELPAYVRERVCRAIANGLEQDAGKFARTMSLELGKAIKDSRAEVNRAIGVFRTSAEEAKRIGGELIDLDWNVGSEGRMGLVRRFPRGVIGAITPFNFPLNLVSHKIGPAIASGNSIVLKPASKTPIIALMLAELIDATEYPKGAISILPAGAAEASPLLEDDRVKLITFTGSADVGWWIKAHCGAKPVVLELGGNAGVVVADDADLEYAITRLLFGTFGVAGQSCISVQRIYVHDSIYDRFIHMFVDRVKKLKVGNPLDDETDIGALVDTTAVENTLASIREAVLGGARLLVGGNARGRLMEPTLLTDTKTSMAVCSKEIFAPVGIIEKYYTFEEAVAAINNSEYGLQAGLFTNRMKDIMYAFRRIECGGVVINDVPTYRVDQMPYGGMKRSGMGREGVRYAIEDMTEPKLLVMNPR
ncbi:MAG: aldehyde dehydrogenase family protein [Candidatus Zixiibacteriota bacterium]